METLVLTVIGDDRPGLVSALSSRLTARGALWERSQLLRLAGKFAGIIEVVVPAPEVDDLVADLRGLGAEGLDVTVARAGASEQPAAQRLSLELVGADRPGIVAEISALLSERRISIEELATSVTEAPMAGGMLFEAHAVLAAPADADGSALRAALESLADELMVDIELADGADGGSRDG
ncbi:glycine cleavage system protein R [Fodinibacter luteus]|uniref:Glycine cleavage system protein R n=1 Tax=Fodinibacter luteus TaxID=552064 RepID=A0ABP8KBX2_9MICO